MNIRIETLNPLHRELREIILFSLMASYRLRNNKKAD